MFTLNKQRRLGVIQADLYKNNNASPNSSDSNNNLSIYSDNDKYENDNFQVNCNRDNTSIYSGNISLAQSDNLESPSLMASSSVRLSSIVCSSCNLESRKDTSNYIILSCCNSIFHIKCLIDKYNVNNLLGNPDDDYYVFDENTITQSYFDKVKCLKCDCKLNYEDVFSIHSKYVLYNKKYTNDYNIQLNSLKDQKNKIENEMKCLNEYISKLENERKISKIIMTKTFTLMSE
jgi:hypothetical protein